MRPPQLFAPALLLLAASFAHAAWDFDDGSISVVAKQSGDSIKEKLNPKAPLSKPVSLGSTSTLKLSLTAKDNGKGKRPHQAFLVLQEQESGLKAPFPLTVKENGKAAAQISQKDIPIQLLNAAKPLKASIVLASFGSSEGFNAPVFNVKIEADPAVPLSAYERPLRYGKKPEIHHIFRPDPKSPPKVVSLFFALAVVATLPALFIGWIFLGANLNHLSKAIGAAPLSHATFFGSIVAMEFVFFMYYTSWNLFQTLPVIGAVAVITLLSGTKALGEVQRRRLAGER